MFPAAKRFLVAAVAGLVALPSLSPGQVFTDDDFLAVDYVTATNEPTRSDIRFNIDYGNIDIFPTISAGFLTASLPEAPNTPVGAASTTGVFLAANTIPDGGGLETFASILPTLANLNVGAGTATPDFKVQVDVFHSVGPGFVDGGGTLVARGGTTNYTIVGLNQANTGTVQVAELNQPTPDTNATGQGLGLAITGDGGASDDYIPIYGGATYFDRASFASIDGQRHYGTTLDGEPVNTNLAGRRLQDFWVDNGFDLGADADPTNDLPTATGDSLWFTPDPDDLAGWDFTDLDNIVRTSYYADNIPVSTDPIHLTCGPDGGNNNCGQDAGVELVASTDAGFQPAGIPSNRWAVHEMFWIDGEFTYVIDGAPVLQITPDADGLNDDDNVFDPFSESGTVVLGHWDRFGGSIADAPNGGNFAVYDNLIVEAASSGDAPDLDAFLVANGFLPAQPLAGDYNDDGTVDAADYTVYRDTLGSTTDLRADGNGNGAVDPADLTVWSDNYGATSATPAAVPEPTAAVLALAGLFFAARRR